MLKYFPILLVFLLFLSISSCSTSNKIAALKPEPDDASPLVYETSPSFINLPISVKLKDVENQTNTLLNGLIYEDNNIEDDNIEMKIWKLAPISIENDKESSGEKIKTMYQLAHCSLSRST